MDSFWRDLRFAARSLRRNRGFAATAVLTMALGMGLNVATFSALDRIFFRALPYELPDQLVQLRMCRPGSNECFGSFPALLAYEARHLSSLTGIAEAGLPGNYRWTREPDGGAPVRLYSVSANLLRVLGVAPIRGRDFTEDDARMKRPVAMLSEETWRQRFAASEDVIGREIWGRAGPIAIVGVLPAGFIPPSAVTDPAWEGIVTGIAGWSVIGPESPLISPVARLRAGANLAAARDEIRRLATSLESALAASAPRQALTADFIRVDSLRRSLFSRQRPTFWLVTAATGALLLLACANLATLLLAHGRSREREAALALALGSSRTRVVRGALLESAVICLLGSAAALALLMATSRALTSVLPPLIARYSIEITSPRVFVAALIAALVCAVAGGLAPSVRASRVDLVASLHRASPSGRRRRSTTHVSLLVAESALGAVLAVSAILMLRSFTQLATDDLGFAPAGLYVVTADPGRRLGDEASLDYHRQALQIASRTPGAIAVAGADTTGVSNLAPYSGFSAANVNGARFAVTASFFDTLRIPLIAGRAFTDDEIRGNAPVAVLNASGANALWPGEPADAILGRPLTIQEDATRRVVGVASDIRRSAESIVTPALYVPIANRMPRGGEIALRAGGGGGIDFELLRQRLRQQLGSVDVGITSVAALVAAPLNDPRFRAVIFVTLGLVAMLIAASGLFAVAAFNVRQREYEMGVRLALGAGIGTIQRMVLTQACRPVLAGAALGFAGAYASTSYLQQFLHRIEPRDPSTYAVVGGIMMGTALAATWLPARRASRLDPVMALKHD
jgi:putative ABC transport system permease protein